MAIREIPNRRAFEHRFFLAVAIAFPLVVLAGFAKTYYLKGFFEAPAVPSLLVHVHGLFMSAWVALFIAQTWLISSRRIRTHMKLGYTGLGLAVLIIVAGIATAVAAAKRGGSTAAPPEIPPLSFMAVPIFDMIVFAVLFGAAVYYRKNAANHKRLMLLTVLNFLPPAVARIPLDIVTAGGPLVFFGVPDLLALIFVIVDTWRNRKLNWVFLAGALVLIASHPVRIILGMTDTWVRFAGWLTSF
jgi:hypothetical protein